MDLHTSEAIIAEVVYVLHSPKLYARARDEIAEGLRTVIGIRKLHVPHKPSVLVAFEHWERSQKLDFADCLAIAHALREQDGRLYSYDRDIGKVEGVSRIEPEDVVDLEPNG